ncbi:MAG: hypothetical protein AB1530_04475 [Candidatus Omnitrophota bacterium]
MREFILHKKHAKAQAFVLLYGILVVAAAILGAFLLRNANERLLVQRQKAQNEVFYLAEGGLEDAIKKFNYAIANYQIDPNIDRYPANGTITTTYSNSTLFPSGATVESFIAAANITNGTQVVSDPDGSTVFVKAYIVTATAVHPTYGEITATLKQAFLRRLIYAFQHAVFYNDDLEILPGASMTFAGRIHTNKDMYLGTHATLTIDNEYLHSAGDIYNHRKDSSDIMLGTVSIKKAGTTEFEAMAGLDSDAANWLTESQTRWNGTVKSSVHGVTELTAPSVGSIQPDGYYASQAGVKIENGVITKSGVPLVEGTDMPAGTVTTTTTFYNNREGKYVRMTNVDLKKLAGYAPGDVEGSPSFANNLPANGLIYATRNDAPSNQSPGVRLVNGSQIYRNSGLTVVSNDPVYVQGSYNTVNKKPSAVYSDAVNLLSNSWSDANSTKSVDYRVASNTEVNAAFISGIDQTSTGHYNGGLENYPRMHEKWTGKELKIKGSFVELWNSQIAQGAWVYGNPQYTAPNRNWSYDTDFASGNMPPFTPWAVEAYRGAWWKE